MKCVNHIVSNILFKFAHKIYLSNDVEVYMLATNILEMHYSYSYNDFVLFPIVFFVISRLQKQQRNLGSL